MSHGLQKNLLFKQRTFFCSKDVIDTSHTAMHKRAYPPKPLENVLNPKDFMLNN